MKSNTPKMAPKMAPMIAVVGCDGSGKSTLSADLLAWLQQTHRADTVYLGLKSGDMGNKIKRWPIIGKALEARLSKKAGQARDKSGKIPGLPTALVIYAFTLKRYRAFKRLLVLRRDGVIVVTDRYPQTEVAGFYDGPGLSAAQAGSKAVANLAAKERALYDEMASYVPDLVIRLNIDAETALARKPDHKPASIAAKVAVTPLLTFNGARIVDLDAKMPYAEELAQAKALVNAVLAEKV